MKVLVAGAFGGAGQGGVNQALENDFDLRFTYYKELKKKCQHEFVKGDLRNYEDVEKMVKGCDAIVHLGGTAKTYADPIYIYQTNVMGTANLLEACYRNKIKKIIYASSIHIYGIPFEPEYFPVDEEHPIKPNIPYGFSKLLSEKLGKGYTVRDNKFSFISLRMGDIIHKNRSYKERFKEDNIGNCAGLLWTHIDARDLGLLIKLALKSNINGFEVFNAYAQDHLFPEIHSLELIKKFFPDIKKIYNNDEFVTQGNRSFLSIKKAKKMLGYKPKYNFADYQKWIKEGKKEEDYYF